MDIVDFDTKWRQWIEDASPNQHFEVILTPYIGKFTLTAESIYRAYPNRSTAEVVLENAKPLAVGAAYHYMVAVLKGLGLPGVTGDDVKRLLQIAEFDAINRAAAEEKAHEETRQKLRETEIRLDELRGVHRPASETTSTEERYHDMLMRTDAEYCASIKFLASVRGITTQANDSVGRKLVIRMAKDLSHA